jgi:hypothetical protein
VIPSKAWKLQLPAVHLHNLKWYGCPESKYIGADAHWRARLGGCGRVYMRPGQLELTPRQQQVLGEGVGLAPIANLAHGRTAMGEGGRGGLFDIVNTSEASRQNTARALCQAANLSHDGPAVRVKI